MWFSIFAFVWKINVKISVRKALSYWLFILSSESGITLKKNVFLEFWGGLWANNIHHFFFDIATSMQIVPDVLESELNIFLLKIYNDLFYKKHPSSPMSVSNSSKRGILKTINFNQRICIHLKNIWDKL